MNSEALEGLKELGSLLLLSFTSVKRVHDGYNAVSYLHDGVKSYNENDELPKYFQQILQSMDKSDSFSLHLGGQLYARVHSSEQIGNTFMKKIPYMKKKFRTPHEMKFIF